MAGGVEMFCSGAGDAGTDEFRTGNWRRSLAAAVRDPDQLIDRLELGDEWRVPARQASRRFPLLVPQSFLRRMQPGDPRDPLLRQVLPLGQELTDTPGFLSDPVGDATARRSAGLLQKYHGRALLIATGSCAVHCRYCFRREYPYADEPRRLDDWEPALDTIAGDRTLKEVILSGGDPLMLTDSRLARLMHRIAAIPHVRRLRIHSRLPIVLPDRVTDSLLQLLQDTRLRPWVVVHANHPREVAADCAAALRQLVSAGITTLNQAVLLRDVNDNAEALVELSERLVDLGVVPYYLHQLDRVRGAAHFEVSEGVGARIVEEMRRRLPGYAVPTYVREVADAPSKVTIREVIAGVSGAG
jgi:EF-P beta-lysylation protein EpmB